MATNKSDVVTTIKRARKAAGLTQQEAADRSGVPLSTYQSYEQGKARPPYERVQAILGALGEAVVQPITTDVRPTETPGEFYLVLSMNGQAFYRFRCIGEVLSDVQFDIDLDARVHPGIDGEDDKPARLPGA